MTQELQDVSLSTAKAIKAESEQQGLYFNTAKLARFMCANYGAEAVNEAKRHVAMYMEIKEPEIANIWKRVVAHITSVQEVEDARRRLKSLKGE